MVSPVCSWSQDSIPQTKHTKQTRLARLVIIRVQLSIRQPVRSPQTQQLSEDTDLHIAIYLHVLYKDQIHTVTY